MTTEIAVRPENGGVSLFAGATPTEVVNAAADAAAALADVIEKQRLYQRISSRKHVLVEGWQTLGSMTGVFAVPDAGAQVEQLGWPMVTDPGPEPELPAAPREGTAAYAEWKPKKDAHDAWAHHRQLVQARDTGRAFGFRIAFTAVKDGRPVGWGEGRCTRVEKRWVNAEDYAIASMAQTRAQSRALSAPLRFVVKMAGYATTPAEEMDERDTGPAVAPAPFGRPADADWIQKAKTALVQLEVPDPGGFLRTLVGGLEGDKLPDAAARTLFGLAWWLDKHQDADTPADA